MIRDQLRTCIEKNGRHRLLKVPIIKENYAEGIASNDQIPIWSSYFFEKERATQFVGTKT